MTIRWITPLLGTAPASAVRGLADIALVDVRDLVDKAGNRADAVAEKISLGQTLLSQGKKTVVCCDYGISRSNAIAAGILARAEGISLEAAVRRVQEATGEGEIKVEPLQVVRAALGEHLGPAQRSRRRTVLLTGGGGFLGKPTAAELSKDLNVIAPLRPELDLARGSTQIDVMVGESGADAIVHLASPRVYTSNVAMGTTLTMLRNVIDVCLVRDIPLVYMSSWEIYSGYRGSLCADEMLPALPRGPYAETKLLCETLIEHSQKHLGLRCAMIRSSPVYGLGSDRPKFIYSFIEKARCNERIVTHQYRNGDPALDLLHVDDLVSLIARTVRAGFTGVLNAGSGTPVTTHAVATMVVDLLGSRSHIERTSIDSDTACIAMDSSKARRLLDWGSTTSFADGLKELTESLTLNSTRE
ncbi:NAD-dependent epimerase/dehydratase family protein [Cupriavidus basilensis]